MNKDVKTLLRSIQDIPGVEMKDTGRGHVSVYLNGQFATSVSSTPSDPRWRDNAVADLRRAGITPSVKTNGTSGDLRVLGELMPVDEIRRKVKAMPNRKRFARFLVQDIPLLYPNLRTYKNERSAEASLFSFIHSTSLGEWAHQLLDTALPQWEKLELKRVKAEEAAKRHERKEEPEKVTVKKKVEPKKAEPTPVVANGDDFSKQYGEALLKILVEEGSTVDDKILDRLDKLAGVR